MSTEFDELLRDGMERFTADLRAPANLVARARSNRRQRLTVRTAASGVAAMTVAGITFAAIPATTAPSTAGNAAASIPERHDVEYLQLTGINQGHGQVWLYGHRTRVFGRSSSRGPLYDEGFAEIKAKNGRTRQVATIVNYRTKTWGRGPDGLALTSPHLACHPLSEIPFPEGSSTLPTWIREVRKLIKCGALKVSGTEQIHGIQTIKLKAARFSEPPYEHETIWVKRTDYAPVRVAEKSASRSIQIDLFWLRPTKANVAMLRVPIPPGFRKVPFSKVSGGSSGSCSVSSDHPHKQTCTHSG